MKIIKKIKKVIISVIMTIMLLPKNIFAMDLTPLYGPPKPEPTFIETIWKTIKTYILPISIIFVFIVGSIIFFKKGKGKGDNMAVNIFKYCSLCNNLLGNTLCKDTYKLKI